MQQTTHTEQRGSLFLLQRRVLYSGRSSGHSVGLVPGICREMQMANDSIVKIDNRFNVLKNVSPVNGTLLVTRHHNIT